VAHGSDFRPVEREQLGLDLLDHDVVEKGLAGMRPHQEAGGVDLPDRLIGHDESFPVLPDMGADFKWHYLMGRITEMCDFKHKFIIFSWYSLLCDC